MNRVIDNARLVLFAVFILASAATIAYQALYIWPMQKCERTGSWWSPKYRECDPPVPIWRITGRQAPAPGKPTPR
jgi:hypothetical protein